MSKGKLINYAKTGKRRVSEEPELILKKPDEQNAIYDAVMQDLSQDYSAYLNDLVKSTKTPPKHKPIKEKIEAKKQNRQQDYFEKQQPKKQKQQSYRKKQDQLLEIDIADKINLKREQRSKFFSTQYQKPQKYESQLITKVMNKQTQKIEIKKQKLIADNIKEDEIINHSFLDSMNNYVNYLQTEHSSQRKQNYQKLTLVNQIIAQNKKLKSKLIGCEERCNAYEQKFKQIQNTVQKHLIHLKTKQKQYRLKIKQLTKALSQAVQKVNEQKDEIEYLQGFLVNFTNQVNVYKNTRNHKTRLHNLIKQDSNQFGKYQQTLLKTLNSDDFRLDHVQKTQESDAQESVQQGLSKIMNTTSFFPVNRSRGQKTLISKKQTSKSRSRQSKSKKNMENFHKMTFKYKQSDSDQDQ